MEENKTSVLSNGLIWFGAGVSMSEILTGTYFAPLGMKTGLLAILIGHVIGCILLFLAGYLGAKTNNNGDRCSQLWTKGKPAIFYFKYFTACRLACDFKL